MTLEEKLALVPEEYKTAREIGLAAATLGALARRGLVEATNTSPKRYRKIVGPAAKIYTLLEENKDDYDTYFSLKKSTEKLKMLCSFSNNVVLDCWGAPYDLKDVCEISFRTRKFTI